MNKRLYYVRETGTGVRPSLLSSLETGMLTLRQATTGKDAVYVFGGTQDFTRFQVPNGSVALPVPHTGKYPCRPSHLA